MKHTYLTYKMAITRVIIVNDVNDLTQSFTFTFRFNLIRFASEVVSWKPSLTSTSDDSCQDAVEWVSDFDANGSTSTLSALQVCFKFFLFLLYTKNRQLQTNIKNIRDVMEGAKIKCLHDCRVRAQGKKLALIIFMKTPRELHSLKS